MIGDCEVYRAQRQRISRLYLRLEELGGMYASLLEEFQQDGDIDIFAEFDQNLLSLRDEIDELPKDLEERFELTCGVDNLSNALNSLLHSGP